MPSRPRSICIHVGAHKTATTHLQNSLAAAAEPLAEAGVMFYGPRDFRWGKPTLQERFDIGNREQDAKPLQDPQTYKTLLKGGHRLLLSEENFSGTLLNLNGRIRGPLYPDLPRRLGLLSARAAPLDVVLGIRNPARLLNSAYGQFLQGNSRLSIADYTAKNPFERVKWADLARRILNVDGVRTLTVWCHEDYGALFPKICRRMTGPGAPAIHPLPGRMHEGMSARAVAAVLDFPDSDPKDAIAAFPISPENPRFDAYDAEDHALSAEFYAAQIDELELLPGLTRLTPT